MERIENVFESVVEVMDGEALPLLQVKEDDYLERIGGIISDTGFLGRLQHGCVDPSPPLLPVTHVSWEGSGNRAPSLGHRVHLSHGVSVKSGVAHLDPLVHLPISLYSFL